MKIIKTQVEFDSLDRVICETVLIKACVRLGGELRVVSGGELRVDGGGELRVGSGGELWVVSGGELMVGSGGELWVDVGGWLMVDVGGNLRVDVGGELRVAGTPIASGELANANLQFVAPLALADNALIMNYVHTCETTHCLAGWACHSLPGGPELEASFGWYAAGLALLGADAAQHFYDSDEAATQWLKTQITA
jgi:hypothetical protein